MAMYRFYKQGDGGVKVLATLVHRGAVVARVIKTVGVTDSLPLAVVDCSLQLAAVRGQLKAVQVGTGEPEVTR